MIEIWKDIKGFEGLYMVSNTGKIKSFTERSLRKNKSGVILSPGLTRGYESVGLCKDGKRTSVTVHRIVAEAFLPNPNNYSEVNHKDENKANNSVENLEWCSRNYNMSYGTARLRQGVSAGRRVKQYVIDGVCIAEYCSIEVASKINNIDGSSIAKCCNGKRKYAGGYFWAYV